MCGLVREASNFTLRQGPNCKTTNGRCRDCNKAYMKAYVAKRGHIARKCCDCGKESIITNRSKQSDRCRSCAEKAKPMTPARLAVIESLPHGFGPNSNAWKGGITPLHTSIRTCDKYLEWRRSILHKDNYTCQGCGKRGGKLEADHHPRLFSEILAAYLESEVGDYLDYSDFWEASGRAVCRPCHNAIGRRPKTYNTKEKTLKDESIN